MSTLHVLGAVLLLSITALNTQRHQIDVRHSQMRTEIDLRATGLATSLLDHLASLPFDPNVEAGDPLLLTPADLFGGAGSFEAAQYLHEIDGLSFTSSVTSGGAPLPYQVEFDVRYVTPSEGSFVTSESPTYLKEVTLALTGALNSSVLIKRIYTPNA